MKQYAAFVVLSALGLTFASGCNPDFSMPWEVEYPRLLGARVEVEGGENRSRPRVGESFRIRQFLATPAKPVTRFDMRYDAQLELCLGVLLSNGSLACGGVEGQPSSIPFPGTVEIPSDDEIVFDGLTVPSELGMLPPPFDEIDRVVLFGAVCVDGKVERVAGKVVGEDPQNELFRCVNNQAASFKDPLLFTTSVLLDIGRPQDDDHHPSFACEAAEGSSDACRAGVKVAGEETVPGSFVLVFPKKPGETQRRAMAWEPRANASDPDSLPWDDCAGTGIPQVRLGDEEYSLRVRFDAKDRETYTAEVEEDGRTVLRSRREELLVSHAVTALGGEIERYFSVIDRNEADQSAELELGYTPPANEGKPAEGLTAAGRLVRFYFVLGDERGGVDYTTRELCLLPKSP